MFNKHKLHPISAVIIFLKFMKEFVVPLLILVIANGFRWSVDENNIWNYIPIFIFFIVLLFSFISGIIRWWTFVYWFEDNEFRVEYGLFVKKKRYIPFDRIQSFHYKETVFHRLFGLVQVMVETAGNNNGRPEVVLAAITKEAAVQIEQETKKVKTDELATGEQELHGKIQQDVHVIHKMPAKDLLLLAATSNSIGVVIAGVAAIFSQISDLIPYDWLFEELSAFIQFGVMVVAATIFLAFVIAWGVSVLITFVNYYDFTVVEENDRIVITKGLFEKKRITLPLNRVQAIKIVENPLRQMMKYATVAVESASGGFGEKEKTITLFPIISRKEMLEPLQRLFPHFDFQMWENLIRPPKKAKPHFYRIQFLLLLPVIICCSYFFYPIGLLSAVFPLIAIMLGLWRYKTTGYWISGNQLTLQYRRLSRVTFIAERKRIQAMEKRQNYFQKRKNIATVQATVMSGNGGLTARADHLNEQDVDEILSWFEGSKNIKKEGA